MNEKLPPKFHADSCAMATLIHLFTSFGHASRWYYF